MTKHSTQDGRRASLLLPLLGLIGFIAIWEGIVGLGIVRTYFLPPPSRVALAFIRHYDLFLLASLVTLRDVVIGCVIGVTLGIGIGLPLGYFRRAHATVGPILLLISPIPIVTFLPLFITWWGLNLLPVLCCGTIAGFFPSLMATIAGVRGVDYRLIEVGRNFGASQGQIFRRIILPAASPQIITGVRTSSQLCFLVTPVAEMIMGDIGLGGVIWRNADLFRIDMVVAGQVALGLLGLGLYAIIRIVERRVLRWMPSKEQHGH